MPYVHKAAYPIQRPTQGEQRELTPGKTHFQDRIVEGDVIYVFVENSRAHLKDSHLVARGRVISAQRTGSTWRLIAEFDGMAPTAPLLTRELGPYARLSNGRGTRGGVEHPERTDIAEVYRRTTMQPLHRITQASAAWLDANHFEG